MNNEKYLEIQAKAIGLTPREYPTFRESALDAVGLTGHPKASMAYGLAYEIGHGNLVHVLSYLGSIAELLGGE